MIPRQGMKWLRPYGMQSTKAIRTAYRIEPSYTAECGNREARDGV
jgi:hypothetical protein